GVVDGESMRTQPDSSLEGSKGFMKALKLLALVVVTLLLTAAPAWAQGTTINNNSHTLSGGAVGAGLGAAIPILGPGYGLGRIGSAALESMARQPEVAGRIQLGMIIIAALLEGVAFFALIICIVVAGALGTACNSKVRIPGSRAGPARVKFARAGRSDGG